MFILNISTNWNKLGSLILMLLFLSVASKTDSISVPQGSFYLYEINIDTGITFQGKIELIDKRALRKKRGSASDARMCL